MSKTSNDNIITAGYTPYNNEAWPCLAKLDQEAELIWSQTYVIENYEWGIVKSVIPSFDGGYLLTGYVKDIETQNAILVIKTDAEGDSLWTRVWDETSLDDEGKTIVETNSGDILVGGYLESLSGFIWKLDQEGNTIWFETPQEGQSSFALTNDDTIISVSVWGDHFINKFDADYNIIWQHEFPYYYGKGDKPFCITSQNNIVVCFSDLPNLGLIKLPPDTAIEESNIPVSAAQLKAYPNPFNPVINFEIQLTNEYTNKAEIQIFNVKGQRVITIPNLQITKSSNQQISWNAENCSSGIYFVNLIQNGKTIQTQKITLLK